MGFGPERPCGVAPTLDYWAHRSTGTAAAEAAAGTSYLVSGNGDGGLTDLLNLAIRDFEHLTFTSWFLGRFKGDVLREKAALIFGVAAPEQDLEPLFQEHLLPFLSDWGVIEDVRRKLRDDRALTCNASGALFEHGKAAQLNQVMAFAVLEAGRVAGRPIRRSSGHVTNVAADGARQKPAGLTAGGGPLTDSFDHIILRHGPDLTKFYEPMGAAYQAHKDHVDTLLAARPELNAPPILAAATFALFEQLKIDKLVGAADKAPMRASAALRDGRLVIGRDRAAHCLVEQGPRSLKHLAEQCERLAGKAQIHLDAPANALVAWPISSAWRGPATGKSPSWRPPPRRRHGRAWPPARFSSVPTRRQPLIMAISSPRSTPACSACLTPRSPSCRRRAAIAT